MKTSIRREAVSNYKKMYELQKIEKRNRRLLRKSRPPKPDGGTCRQTDGHL